MSPFQSSSSFLQMGQCCPHVHGVVEMSSLTWKVVALGTASGCCLCWVALQLGQKDFLPCGAFLWGKGFLQISLVPNYIVTGMDVADDFTTGIWVVTVKVATVGVGTAGSTGFMGEVRVAGKGWAITLTFYLLFTGALALLFWSTFLGTKAFLVEEFLSWEGVLVHGCNCGWGLGLGPNLPANSKYVFIFLIREG